MSAPLRYSQNPLQKNEFCLLRLKFSFAKLGPEEKMREMRMALERLRGIERYLKESSPDDRRAVKDASREVMRLSEIVQAHDFGSFETEYLKIEKN